MNIHKINIDGITYHLAEQSAEKQMELFEQLGARILANFVNSDMEKIETDFLFGVLLAIKKIDGTSIEDIGKNVLYKCFAENTTDLVDLSHFQGKIASYTRLVAEGVRANLEDFFTSIESQAFKEREKIRQQELVKTASKMQKHKKKKS